jgi:DNA-binding phage protein
MGEKLTTHDPAEDLQSNEAIAVFMEEAFKTEMMAISRMRLALSPVPRG